MKTIMNYLSYVPRSFALFMVAIAAIALPLSSFAAPEVRLESDMGVLNVSQNEELPYKDSTDAMVDEVVKIQVWYHNMEDFDSGKIGENLRMSIDLPNEPGKEQVISSTVTADNANTVTNTSTVNLSLDHAFLEYIPDSAEFRYNKEAKNGNEACQTEDQQAPAECYVTEKISDQVVTSDNGVVLEEQNLPCFAYEATVTILARVKAPVVTVNKTVRHAGDDSDAWTTRLTDVKPGDELDYQIRFENKGNTTLKDVMVGDDLPKYHTYVEGSTKLMNTNHPNGVVVENDNLTRGGINVGAYKPGAVGYVMFTAKIDESNVFEKCGDHEVANRAAVRPEGMNEFENWARVVINVECEEEQPEQPVFRCEDLTADRTSIKPGQDVTFTTDATARNGAEITEYRYNFGDGSDVHVTDNAQVTHTYDEAGTFRADVTVVFTVDGEQQADSEGCAVVIKAEEKPVTPPEQPEQPEELPDAGPAQTLMAVAGTGVLGQGVRMYVSSRKKLLGSLLNR